MSTTKIKLKKTSLLEELDDLNKKQLEEVVARARYLIQSKETTRDNRDGEFFYICWAQEVRECKLGQWPPYWRYKQHRSHPSYDRNIKDLKVFTQDAFGRLTPVQRAFVHRLYSSLIIDYCEKRNLLITPNALPTYLQWLPSLFRNAFPGYIEAGMAKALIRSEKDINEGS